MSIQKCVYTVLSSLANEKWQVYFNKLAAENQPDVHYGKDLCCDEFELVSWFYYAFSMPLNTTGFI